MTMLNNLDSTNASRSSGRRESKKATHANTTVLWYEHGSRWHQVMNLAWMHTIATLKLKSRRRWHLNNQ